MISSESLTEEWIQLKRVEHKGDPIIIEKVIRALILLEALESNQLEFIFRGGTALMLMIQEPRRFSIDIDIIIENREQDIETILEKIVASTDFTNWEEQKRNKKSFIEKRHFKLFYKPIIKMKGDINYILLDIVFEENPYVETHKTPISHFLALEEDSPINVITPTLPAILGDKLTAYGPNTTGVPFTKPMEMLKQIYDVSCIMDRLPNLEGVRENFIQVAHGELAYKDLDPDNFQLIIDDVIACSFNYCVYGRIDKDSFATMQLGVSKLSSYVYGLRFRQPEAQTAVAKASYIAKQIEKKSTIIEFFNKTLDMSEWVITDHYYSGLNKLKKHNLEAFHYWYKILES